MKNQNLINMLADDRSERYLIDADAEQELLEAINNPSMDDVPSILEIVEDVKKNDLEF